MEGRLQETTRENVHVALRLPQSFSDEAIKTLLTDLDDKGISTTVVRMPGSGPYAASEWLVDGAISLLIMKTLFEGSINEAGKDVYTVVKSWLKKVAIDARLIKVRIITGSQSTEKLNTGYTQSFSITPHIQLKEGNIIKLLFDERLSNEDWEIAIERMFDATADHYENYPNDRLTELTKDLITYPRQRVYALIDIESKEWIFFNDLTLMNFERNKS